MLVGKEVVIPVEVAVVPPPMHILHQVVEGVRVERSPPPRLLVVRRVRIGVQAARAPPGAVGPRKVVLGHRKGAVILPKEGEV